VVGGVGIGGGVADVGPHAERGSGAGIGGCAISSHPFFRMPSTPPIGQAAAAGWRVGVVCPDNSFGEAVHVAIAMFAHATLSGLPKLVAAWRPSQLGRIQRDLLRHVARLIIALAGEGKTAQRWFEEDLPVAGRVVGFRFSDTHQRWEDVVHIGIPWLPAGKLFSELYRQQGSFRVASSGVLLENQHLIGCFSAMVDGLLYTLPETDTLLQLARVIGAEAGAGAEADTDAGAVASISGSGSPGIGTGSNRRVIYWHRVKAPQDENVSAEAYDAATPLVVDQLLRALGEESSSLPLIIIVDTLRTLERVDELLCNAGVEPGERVKFIMYPPPVDNDPDFQLSYVEQFYLQRVLLDAVGGASNALLVGFKSGGLDFLNFHGVSTVYIYDRSGETERVRDHLPALFPDVQSIFLNEVDPKLFTYASTFLHM